MKLILTISLLIAPMSSLISGCSTTVAVIAPNGDACQLVTCALERDCYADSAKACGGKYKILDRYSENVSSEGSTSYATKLLIRCDSAQ